MDGFHNLGRRPETGNHDGHFVFDARLNILSQPVIALMDYLVNCVRGNRQFGISRRELVQLGCNALEPLIQHRLGARVKRRKRANNPGLALRNNKLRS
jgi:hypothetical protein